MNKKELFNPISAEVAQDLIESKKDVPTFLKSKAIAELWDNEAKSQAFFSATVAKTDLLEAFHYRVGQIVSGQMEAGQAAQWVRDFLNTDGASSLTELGYLPPKYLPIEREKKVVELGSQRRIKLILEQNTRMALSTGEYAAAQENGVTHLRYKTKEDSRVRPSHALLDNKVWDIDDPVWQKIYPPIDYGCRCYVEQIKEGVTDDEDIKVEPKGNLPGAIEDGSTPLAPTGYTFDVTQGLGRPKEAKYEWSEVLQERYKDKIIPFIESQTNYLKSKKRS
jgi:SPP1 gp7 family putative phage head morphogenesis protein